MAIYAIGDLQGCHDELRQLLDRLKFEPQRDRLWLTGDLVNRGPDSLACLRFVHSLGTAATCVLGNHDLHLLAVAQDPARLRRGDDSLRRVLDAPDCGVLLDWLRRLPLLHHDPALDAVLVHAGLPPDWDLAQAKACAREAEALLRGHDYADFFQHMYGDQPAYWSQDLASPDRLRFIINCFTRLRYCHPDGRLALEYKGSPDTAPQGLLPWFRIKARRTRGQRILFGHWSTLGRVAWIEDQAWGLDSGCVWGGSLSALRLDVEPWQLTQLACAGHRSPGAD